MIQVICLEIIIETTPYILKLIVRVEESNKNNDYSKNKTKF